MMKSLFLAVAAVIGASSLARAETRVVRGAGFEIAVKTPSTPRLGMPIEIMLTIDPNDGRKLNEDYPMTIAITVPADVSTAKRTYNRADARAIDEHRAELPIVVTPRSAGEKPVSLEIKFAVCSSSACEPQRESVTVSLSVR